MLKRDPEGVIEVKMSKDTDTVLVFNHHFRHYSQSLESYPHVFLFLSIKGEHLSCVSFFEHTPHVCACARARARVLNSRL